MNNSNYLTRAISDIDWNFSSFGNEGLNSFHWYPATFISAIPGSLIPLFSNENEIVFDTFCGTSVTGLEAIRLGRKYVGVDNNPIAVLISKSKVLFPDTESLKKIFENLTLINTNHPKSHPNEEILKKWYHKDTYHQLNIILTVISNIENPTLRIPAQAIFSSILKTASSQAKHWGWVCDNVLPKPTEIVYKNAFDIFLKALHSYSKAVDDVLVEIKNRGLDNRRRYLREQWEISCGDSLSKMKSLDNDSIDLILTSPPYYGVADYVKAQRLSFLWFTDEVLPVEGYSHSDFERLRTKETGTRSTRHKQNSHDLYMQYLRLYLTESHRILKSGHRLILIMGDSKSRQNTISPIEEYATEIGFEQEYEFQRQIKNTKRRLMARVKNEEIRVLIKK